MSPIGDATLTRRILYERGLAGATALELVRAGVKQPRAAVGLLRRRGFRIVEAGAPGRPVRFFLRDH